MNLNEARFSQKLTGFSALELLLVLGVLSFIIFASFNLNNFLFGMNKGQKLAQETYDYADKANRYIKAHRVLLKSAVYVFGAGIDTRKFIAIPDKVLREEGFVDHLPSKNILNQEPCIVVFWANNQLQALLYYRINQNSRKQLSFNELNAGLQHVGNMIGLYTIKNGVSKIIGASGDWGFSHDFISEKFQSIGTAYELQTNYPGKFQCGGKYVAPNSYVINLASMVELGKSTFKDATVHRVIDPLFTNRDLSNNSLDNDLIMMHYDTENPKIIRKSGLIFQLNPDPNLQPDPNEIATLQSYESSVNGIYRENWYKPNSRGRKNKQLGIDLAEKNGKKGLIITGFRQSSDDENLFLGEVIADSFQPRSVIKTGTRCMHSELGTMALQEFTSNSNDVSQIIGSQVQCTASILCPKNTENICYLPITGITINIPGHLPSSPDNEEHRASRWFCPTSLYIDMSSAKIGQVPRPSTHPVSFCDWGKHKDPIIKCMSWFDSPTNAICSSVLIMTVWQEGGGWLCFSHRFREVYGGNFRLNCTNELERLPSIVINR